MRINKGTKTGSDDRRHVPSVTIIFTDPENSKANNSYKGDKN
jgi:hypothetical protein